MPDGFWFILDAIAHKQKKEVCPVIKDIFAVSVDGTIYPCHMLNGIAKNSLGRINAEHIFNSQAICESNRSVLHLKQNGRCEDCWGQNLCSGCAVKRFYDLENNEFTKEPKAELCDLTLRHFERILLMIAAIRKKPALWEALILKAKEREGISINN